MSRKEPKTLRVAGLRPFLPQTVPRTVCRFADRRELKDGRRKIIRLQARCLLVEPVRGCLSTLGSAREHQRTGWLGRNHP